MMTALSTKVLSAELIAEARLKGLEIECLDFIETKSLSFNRKQTEHIEFDTIAFTSANAVQFFFQNPDARVIIGDKQIFALQGKTQSLLNDSGYKAFGTSNHASALADVIIQTGRAKGVLHVCGNLKLSELETKLNSAGIHYFPLLVYETVLLQDVQVKDKFDVIMFYSPSGVESFFSKNTIENQAICCCIGDTTAIALKKRMPEVKVILPLIPSAESMIAAILAHYKKASD
jgi:uroporphyrinogen-III synthase